MRQIIAHALTASLALFTLSDGPVDRAAETPASKAGEPVKGPAAARPGEAGKAAAPVKAAPGKPPGPGHASDATKAAAPVKAPEPAKPADAKPCEPIKPCAID